MTETNTTIKNDTEGVQVGIRWIDPSVAKELLARNTKNRKQAVASIERYASDMANGRWVFNGAPIVIDSDGVLADGQHRLEALIGAAVTLPFVVVDGVNPAAFETIDDGKKRTVGDVLSVEGFPNSTTLAAVANLSLKYQTFGNVHSGLQRFSTKTQQVEWASDKDNQRQFFQFAPAGRAVYKATRITDSTVIFSSITLAKRYGITDQILAFWERVETGMADARGAGDPAMALRSFAMSQIADRKKRSVRADVWIAAIFRAFIAEMDGSNLKLIRVTQPVVLPDLP